MNPGLGKVLVEITRTVGKAMLAGLGVEIARTAGEQLRKRVNRAEKDREKGRADKEREKAGPGGAEKDEAKAAGPRPAEADVDAVKRRNEELEAEVRRLKEELAAARGGPHPAGEPTR